MGLITATIELTNLWDLKNERHELADSFDIKTIHVEMLIGTGSLYMCINESVRDHLNLTFSHRKRFKLADGTVGEFDIAGPIQARFENRSCIAEAIVLPGNSQCLFGAMVMEAMDVLISPARQQLIVNPNHPDHGLFRL